MTFDREEPDEARVIALRETMKCFRILSVGELGISKDLSA